MICGRFLITMNGFPVDYRYALIASFERIYPKYNEKFTFYDGIVIGQYILAIPDLLKIYDQYQFGFQLKDVEIELLKKSKEIEDKYKDIFDALIQDSPKQYR